MLCVFCPHHWDPATKTENRGVYKGRWAPERAGKQETEGSAERWRPGRKTIGVEARIHLQGRMRSGL